MNCVECDYLLDGLAPEGVCPECGVAVSLSIKPQMREPESEVTRVMHSAIITLLCTTCVAELLQPRLRWYYGPTEYGPTVESLVRWAFLIGAATVIADIVMKRWGLRLLVIVVLTAFLLFVNTARGVS